MEEDRAERLTSIAISVLMVVTGSMNTLAAKWADQIEFDHPFFQTICMFAGEFSCLIVFFIVHYVKKRRWQRRNQIGESGAVFDLNGEEEEPAIPQKFNPFIFLPPALCDVVATSTMYVGLNLTTASSFQMLRGSVIIFTGLLSVTFLRAQLRGYRWLGMAVVSLGLLVVGVSDIIFDPNPNDDFNAIITGDLLIVIAQIIVAVQMVTEQNYLLQYDVPPLLAVGLEGLFGMVILSVLLIPMYYIHVPETFSKNPFHRLEDVFYAFRQIRQRPIILLALFFLIISIAFFNFAGVTVTKRLSATTRMVLDSVRILVIWLFSIPFFNEQFIPLQLLGFGLLIVGMFIYNDLVLGPWFRRLVLPRMGENRFTLWCASFCGIGMDEDQQQNRLVSNEEEQEEE